MEDKKIKNKGWDKIKVWHLKIKKNETALTDVRNELFDVEVSLENFNGSLYSSYKTREKFYEALSDVKENLKATQYKL